MSEINNSAETCEFVREIEAAAREVRRKASDDWSSPVSTAYYQCSLELRRIVSRRSIRYWQSDDHQQSRIQLVEMRHSGMS
jgi:hypothetical protein